MATPATLLFTLVFAAQAGVAEHPVAGDTADLDRYRTGRPDPRVRQVPDALTTVVREHPELGLPQLVDFLLEGTDDPFLQAKRLHDWVALNLEYDLESLLNGERVTGGAEGALGTGRAVCGGFAGVQQLLGEHADLEIRTLEGYGRGLGFTPFGDEPVGRATHAWNAVQIDGAWYLMDPTWDAGTVEGTTWVRRYSTDYLFVAPEDFAHTHLPEDPAWQLLAQPLDAQAFQDSAFLKGGFFTYGLDFTVLPPRTSAVGSEARLRLRVPPGVQLSGRLETAEGRPLEGRTIEQWSEHGVTVLVRFPEQGAYRLLLFAGPIERDVTWSVAELGFEASEGLSATFPTTYGRYEKGRAAVIEPLDLPPVPQNVRFTALVPDVYAVSVAVGEGPWHDLEPRRGDRWVGRIPIEPGQRVVLNAQRNPGDHDWDTLVVWPVVREDSR